MISGMGIEELGGKANRQQSSERSARQGYHTGSGHEKAGELKQAHKENLTNELLAEV